MVGFSTFRFGNLFERKEIWIYLFIFCIHISWKSENCGEGVSLMGYMILICLEKKNGLNNVWNITSKDGVTQILIGNKIIFAVGDDILAL